MKGKDVFKLLFPGVVVGLVLGFSLGMLVGVNTTDAVPNYIGGGLCCLIPTLLNCVIVMKGTAKLLKKEISILEILKRIIPHLLIAFAVGFLSYFLVMEKMVGLDSRELTRVANAIYQANLGVMVSTTMAFVAMNSFVHDNKQAKRSSKKKTN